MPVTVRTAGAVVLVVGLLLVALPPSGMGLRAYLVGGALVFTGIGLRIEAALRALARQRDARGAPDAEV